MRLGQILKTSLAKGDYPFAIKDDGSIYVFERGEVIYYEGMDPNRQVKDIEVNSRDFNRVTILVTLS